MKGFFSIVKKIVRGLIIGLGPTVLLLVVGAAIAFGYSAIKDKLVSAHATPTPKPTVPYVIQYSEEELERQRIYDEAYSDGYNDGYSDGSDDGISVGYDNGYDEGYDLGYRLGFEESRSQVLDYISEPIFHDYGFAVDGYFDLLPQLP